MGACWSKGIDAGGRTGVNPANLSKDGNIVSCSHGKLSSTSILPTRRSESSILQAINLNRFTYSDLIMATGNFHSDNLLGEGFFGSVYKGWIDVHSLTPTKTGTGLAIAVKNLNIEGSQGHKEWLAEINYLGQLHHPNLVKLIGYSIEDDHRLLIYEFMPQGSFESHLFRRLKPLSWSIRLKVALGAAKGLAFLHISESKVIYRDFNTSNILLDSNYNAKLSDFGLARDGPPGDRTHVSTRVVGTFGYSAPECILSGHLSTRSDVYSFGVVLLELLSGRRAVEMTRLGEKISLVMWATPHLSNKRKISKMVDVRLEGKCSLPQASMIAKLARHCLSHDPTLRPKMDEVVTALEQLMDSTDKEKGAPKERHRLFQ